MTDTFTTDLEAKTALLHVYRTKRDELTPEQLRDAFDLFCDIEDCYPTSAQAAGNWNLFITGTPLSELVWSRAPRKPEQFTYDELVDLSDGHTVNPFTGRRSGA